MLLRAYSLERVVARDMVCVNGEGCQLQGDRLDGGRVASWTASASPSGHPSSIVIPVLVTGIDRGTGAAIDPRPNMKELRFTLPDGEWPIAFAFDPERQAVLLVGGSKSGVSERQFYRDLIRVADERFGAHLRTLLPKAGGKG